MYLGIRTNQTEYPLDDVSLEIAYGWAEGYLDETGQEGYETYSVLIVAYDSTLIGKLPYNEPFENYDVNFFTDKAKQKIPSEKSSNGTLFSKLFYKDYLRIFK